MKNKLLSVLLVSMFPASCHPQDTNKQENMNREKQNRQAIYAGRFYASNALELKNDITKLFSVAVPPAADCEKTLAIISPHAGYIFSGEVAASAFNQLCAEKEYKNIFILASSHHAYYNGASIYNLGNFVTPLGEITVNIELANRLIAANEYFSYYPEGHEKEHSLEVQLPLLQMRIKHKTQIVPIVIGSQSPEVCASLAATLKPYFTPDNVFIISSDFSHYPDYNNAQTVDRHTAEAICTNDPVQLMACLQANEDKGINNLSTSLCGWTSVLTLLYITREMNDVEYSIVQYKNSGDSPYGEKNRVVGYCAIAIKQKNSNTTKVASQTSFMLSEKDKQQLLAIARNTLDEYVKKGKIYNPDTKNFSPLLMQNSGAFVSLYKNKALRGCIGRFDASDPLYMVIREMTIASASKDRRFNPVSPAELNDIVIEISVLSPMRKIQSIDEIVLGRHGIYIKKGYQAGTFLPQVAIETGWNMEHFLGHCAQDKAGIGWYGWKDADIYIYEALVFGEK